VLFLCTGNSCRSQIAEALVNHYLGDRYVAVSAGTQPAGYVHPVAIQVLEEVGVETVGLRSKSTDEFRGETFDTVVTVCGDAAENCPVWLAPGNRVHIGFADPAKVTGDTGVVLQAFRETRDQIRASVIDFLARAS
jgi:arsenate reductase